MNWTAHCRTARCGGVRGDGKWLEIIIFLLYSIVIYGHMKYFIFRKDQNGFDDFIRSFNRTRMYIFAHKHDHVWIEHEEYTEANWWYVNYLEYMKGLTEEKKSLLEQKKKDIFQSVISLEAMNYIYVWEMARSSSELQVKFLEGNYE